MDHQRRLQRHRNTGSARRHRALYQQRDRDVPRTRWARSRQAVLTLSDGDTAHPRVHRSGRTAVPRHAWATRVAIALVVIVAVLVLAAPAAARTIAADLAVAHTHWQSDVCAGQWQVVPDATLPARGHAGMATGLGYAWDGARWHWYVARCEFAMDPNITGAHRCAVVLHEVGHFVHGPTHAGPMSPRALSAVTACDEALHNDAARTSTAITITLVTVLRTRAQIARAMRLRLRVLQARVRARQQRERQQRQQREGRP